MEVTPNTVIKEPSVSSTSDNDDPCVDPPFLSRREFNAQCPDIDALIERRRRGEITHEDYVAGFKAVNDHFVARKKREQEFAERDERDEYRVVVVIDDGKGKKWTPQQQILQSAIAYVQNLQNVRNEVTLQRDEANAKLEQAEARCAQERANAESLWETVQGCRLELAAQRKEGDSWKAKTEELQEEVKALKREVEELKHK
ncbi:hypothetical protein EWM64_g2401 [Hericium alpestre]|uniref:Uncharacterized protein n=1 Tax=Hericium alpestre TaxID=135208 RepID=A0A4Z0A5V2_9AGAM|nr:hypothetical protein EWM64_g2401 [Hericium alpestre]